MKLLPVTDRKKEVVAHAMVDDDLFPHLSKMRWYDNGWGYPHTNHQNDDGSSIHVSLHSIVFKDKYGRHPLPGYEIDHIDQNKLNAQRSNLRELTRSFNCANKPKQPRNTSGYKGVSWNKNEQKWETRIQVNRKLVFLGYHTDKHEAARAVNRAYEKHFPGISIPNPIAEVL